MRNRKKTSPARKTAGAVTVPGYDSVLDDIVELLNTARRASARTVNAIMTATYWEMGRGIVEYEQGGQERADYGEELVKRLSCDLVRRFGRGFSERNLRKCRAFYLGWPIWPTASAESDSTNFSALSRKSQPLAISHLRSIAACLPLPWSHADIGQMHLYLNYARAHWVQPEENAPIGLILCTEQGESLARYALEGLPNKMLIREYQTALPSEELLAEEIRKARRRLESRITGR